MRSDETVIDQIKERLGGGIALFLGAGASAAVKLPTMVSFLDQAYGEGFVSNVKKGGPYSMGSQNVNEIRNNRATMVRRLFHSAGLKAGQPALDLEDIFDFIHKSGVLNTSKDTIKSLLWMFKTCHEGSAWPFDGYRDNFKSHAAVLDSWIEDFNLTINELKQKMYASFLVDSDRPALLSDAARIYKILPKLFRESPPVVFTTNFDTIFEALNNSGKLEYALTDGFGAGRAPQFNLENYLVSTTKNPLYYFKLHGSVTWQHAGESAIRDCFPSVPKSVALVEPVISKRPTQQPFPSLYQIFEGVLERCRILITVGFSFRDDTLREMIRERLDMSDSLYVIVVAPKDATYPALNVHLESLSAYPTVTWIQKFWGEAETEEDVLKRVAAIELKNRVDA